MKIKYLRSEIPEENVHPIIGRWYKIEKDWYRPTTQSDIWGGQIYICERWRGKLRSVSLFPRAVHKDALRRDNIYNPLYTRMYYAVAGWISTWLRWRTKAIH